MRSTTFSSGKISDLIDQKPRKLWLLSINAWLGPLIGILSLQLPWETNLLGVQKDKIGQKESKHTISHHTCLLKNEMLRYVIPSKFKNVYKKFLFNIWTTSGQITAIRPAKYLWNRLYQNYVKRSGMRFLHTQSLTLSHTQKHTQEVWTRIHDNMNLPPLRAHLV